MAIMRDGFTMPKEDIALINQLKLRCMKIGVDVNKSELVRAGLHALNNSRDNELKAVISDLPKIRAGRPSLKKRNAH